MPVPVDQPRRSVEAPRPEPAGHLIDTACQNLTPQGLCGIYSTRPGICKDFDWQECEQHMTPDEGPPDKWLFYTADEFLVWFEKQRPKAFRRFRDYMKRKHGTGEKPELLQVRSARA